MAKRVLAFVAAAAMVVGAIAYRSALDDGGTAAGDNVNASGTIVCALELGSVCDALPGATIEPAETTARRLLNARSRQEAGVTAWLAPGPWAAMVDDTRAQQKKSKIFGQAEGLAHSDLVAVVRLGKLPAQCGAAATWKCLGDAAQDPSFLLGADPAATSSGLFIRAAALSGFFGNSDYASNDFADAQGWLDNLERRISDASSRGARDLQLFLISAPDVTAFLTTAQAAKKAPNVVIPSPAADITVILALAAGSSDDGIARDSIRDLLQAEDWKAGPAKGDDGLPSPGVLLALSEVVE